MTIKSLSSSSLLTHTKYISMLAGNAAFTPGSFYHLETVVLSASAASLSFTNLVSTYGSDFTHLQIRATSRGNRSASSGATAMRFNGDSGANYTRGELAGTGSTPSQSYLTGQDFTQFSFYLAANASPTTTTTGAVVDILDAFNTSKTTVVRGLFGHYTASDRAIVLENGQWINTAAIDSIEISDRFSTLKADSRFSLYGWKAA